MSLIPFAGAVQKFNRPRDTGYRIERSLRFNSADSAYLNRTPASAGNRKTMTYSVWVKRSVLGGQPRVFGGAQDNYLSFALNSNAIEMNLRNGGSASNVFLVTTPVYRDPSAWYHIVMAIDTTQATASNRIKLYVNGVQVTAFGTENYPTQNNDMNSFNNNVAQYIGCFGNPSEFFDGYMTEFNFIDGSALTPTSFGEFNATTGVWQPKAYEGEYGTNGFYLNFSDNSGTTSSTLGKDQAGSNDWTPNNFSVTAGAGNDSLVDSPTRYGTDTGVGGEVRGNYCVLNPLSKTSPATISNGNLDVSTTSSSANISIVAGTIGVSSGKWYWEVVGTAVDSTRMAMYVCDATKYGLNLTASTGAYGYGANGQKIQGDGTNWFGTGSAYGNSWTTNDVIGVALDMDNGKVWFSKNGTWQASGDPAAGTNEAFSGLSGSKTCGMYLYTEGSATTAVFNLGQRPFSYTAPSGFKALCTTNLPTPTIADGGDYFNTVLYSGTSANQSITGVGFQPDWVWVKVRNAVGQHSIFDAVRGATIRLGNGATSVGNAAESTVAESLKSFDSDGFTFGNEAGNNSGETYVAWNWNAGGSTVINTDGTISSNVRANPTAGFSIITYTGTGSANATVGHGLSVSPSMIIIKNRVDSVQSFWSVYHKSAFVSGADPNVLYLNTTATQADDTNVWGPSPDFNSTTFKLGDYNGSNGSGDALVAYCFAEVPGYSAFGSYVGNGSTDGPFVYTGFRPAFVMVKRINNDLAGWVMFNTSNLKYNLTNADVEANDTRAEVSGSDRGMDWLSNGFKLRSDFGSRNASGTTYIYMAFASSPFQYSLAR